MENCLDIFEMIVVVLQNVYLKEVINGLTREIIFNFENID